MLLVVVCAVLNAGAGTSSTVCWCFATTWLYNERTIGAVLEHELAQSEETVQFSRHSNSNCCLKVKGHHNLYNARTTRSVCVSKVALLKLARYQAAKNFCWNQLMKAIGSVYAELIMKPPARWYTNSKRTIETHVLHAWRCTDVSDWNLYATWTSSR